MTHPTPPISPSEPGARELREAIFAGIDWNGHLYHEIEARADKLIAAALRQSADTARAKAIGECETVARAEIEPGGVGGKWSDAASWIADAIAALAKGSA